MNYRSLALDISEVYKWDTEICKEYLVSLGINLENTLKFINGEEDWNRVKYKDNYWFTFNVLSEIYRIIYRSNSPVLASDIFFNHLLSESCEFERTKDLNYCYISIISLCNFLENESLLTSINYYFKVT